MQRTAIVLMALAIAGCATQKVEKHVELDLSKNLVPDCYTVDLFDPYRLEYPEAGVPPENFGFLGVWKKGGWNGSWCHDLYVTQVRADGTAEVLDAYGPVAANGIEATVFKRQAKIENGELVVSGNFGVARYRLNGEYLQGNRRDLFGKYEITLARVDGIAQVPIPQPKPTRLASR